MQFFYIDYFNNNKKERNIGFLKIENDGMSVCLRGVPVQCGNECKVYGITAFDEKNLLGKVTIKNGYGMERIKWNSIIDFESCVQIEIPLYGTRFARCVIRDKKIIYKQNEKSIDNQLDRIQIVEKKSSISNIKEKNEKEKIEIKNSNDTLLFETGFITEHKWSHLVNSYQLIHIYPEAQTILIKPKDIIVLTKQYHTLASNSFLLHSYYNYRQLLLFRYPYGTENLQNKTIDLQLMQQRDTSEVEYYIGVAGIYNERERRLAELFGFEGFESGESRMNEESKRNIYSGCFGYYMKKVEI